MNSIPRRVTRAVLVIVCLAGTGMFCAGFAATYLARSQIEVAAQGFVRAEVERKARARFGDRVEAVVDAAGHARAIAAGLNERAGGLQKLSASGWPDLIGRLLAERCDIDCEEAKEAKGRENAARVRGSMADMIAATKAKIAGLRGFITGVYKARLYALISEIRVFTGLNAALFGLMLITLWFNRRDMRPVLLPVAVLVVSTASAASLYLVTQDWLWSILLSDYIGFWYLGIVGLTLAFVCDIAFLQARITLNILGSLPQALVPPC